MTVPSQPSRAAAVDGPLVLHVIPTAVARGAQREARALATRLDAPGIRYHRVLSLFAGPDQVGVDLTLDHPGGDTAAVGFDPRLVLRLRSLLTAPGRPWWWRTAVTRSSTSSPP